MVAHECLLICALTSSCLVNQRCMDSGDADMRHDVVVSHVSESICFPQQVTAVSLHDRCRGNAERADRNTQRCSMQLQGIQRKKLKRRS